jgi:hypothetical protein
MFWACALLANNSKNGKAGAKLKPPDAYLHLTGLNDINQRTADSINHIAALLWPGARFGVAQGAIKGHRVASRLEFP